MWNLGRDGVPLVIVVKNGILESVKPCRNADHAEQVFKEKLLEINDALSEGEIEEVIEDGAALFNGSYLQPSYEYGLPIFDTSIFIHWITGSYRESDV